MTADTSPTEETPPPPPEAEPKKPVKSTFSARDVVQFIEERYELGKTTDGVLFAMPRDPGLPRVARDIRALKTEIQRNLYRERGIVPGSQTIGAALDTALGLAEETRVSRVYVRAAEIGARSIQLDLGDLSGRFVEVSPYGWEVRDPLAEADTDAARAIFRRTAATMTLPTPVEGGTRDDLRRLLGLEASDPRWMLIWGWLVGTLFESVPRPILWALGPQGSGKSTRARMALSVVEPVSQLGREPGKNERDDTTSALGRFIPSWDNIGSVSPATSDWLCRLTTGVEIDRRLLYSNDDLHTATLRRTAVATSIVLPFGLGPDALERLVLVELDRVAEGARKSERELWAEFEKLHPAILGALLDDVAGVLRNLPGVQASTRSLPRMADYAQLLYALDEHIGEDDAEGYAAAYIRSVSSVLADRALADPLTAALLALVKQSGGTWRGPSSGLLEKINFGRPDDPRAAWPSSPASLSAAIRKGQETLRAAGLIVSEGRTKDARWIRLELVADEDNADAA